jgi:tetratricopeptide (TPR) repeat protein
MAAKLFAGLLVAVAMASYIVADEPTDKRAEYLREFETAKQLVDDGNFAEGIKALNALAAKGRHPGVFMEIARCFKELGETEMALNAYSMALVTPGVQPELPLEAYLERGQLYLASGRFREAIDDFTQGIQMNPVNSELQYGRGLAVLNMVRNGPMRDGGSVVTIAQAIKSFDSAIRFNDENALAHYERGMAKLMLGSEIEAREDLSRALSISPGELTGRLVELTVKLQTENDSLRNEVSTLKAKAKAEAETKEETGRGLPAIAETLLEIRDLLQMQMAR